MLYVIQPTYMIQTLFSNKETEGDQATIRPSGVAQFNDEPALTGATHRTVPIRHCEITREERRGWQCTNITDSCPHLSVLPAPAVTAPREAPCPPEGIRRSVERL